jgi:hypothetical protein
MVPFINRTIATIMGRHIGTAAAIGTIITATTVIITTTMDTKLT